MGPMGILQNMGYANSMSTQNVHYDWAAIHIRESGGKSWTTNVLDMYTTVAQIPHPPHS